MRRVPAAKRRGAKPGDEAISVLRHYELAASVVFRDCHVTRLPALQGALAPRNDKTLVALVPFVLNVLPGAASKISAKLHILALPPPCLPQMTGRSSISHYPVTVIWGRWLSAGGGVTQNLRKAAHPCPTPSLPPPNERVIVIVGMGLVRSFGGGGHRPEGVAQPRSQKPPIQRYNNTTYNITSIRLHCCNVVVLYCCICCIALLLFWYPRYLHATPQ